MSANPPTPFSPSGRRPAVGRRALAPALGVAVALASAEAHAADPAFGPNDVATAFFVSKSDDRNRVDYGVRLDADCAPSGEAPVFPYWREFENSPPVRTHSLGWIEYLGYGISEQRITRPEGGGAEIAIRLKAVARDLVIAIKKGADGKCQATVRCTLAGISGAQLSSAHIKLRRALSVEYIELFGREPATGASVVERIRG